MWNLTPHKEKGYILINLIRAYNVKWTRINCITMYVELWFLAGKCSMKEEILKGDSSYNFAAIFETLKIEKE